MLKTMLLVLLMASIISVSIAYAMWFDTLYVNVNVSTGSNDPSIGSYRGFKCCIKSGCCSCIECKGLEEDEMRLSVDRMKLYITNTTCCGHCHKNHDTLLWVGLIIEQDGSVPVKLSSVYVAVNGNYSSLYTEYYIYGPYKHGVGVHEWGNIDPEDLPFPGYKNSVILEDGEKAIAWIMILIENCTSINLIEVKPVFTPWNQE